MPESFNPYHRWLGISPKDQPPNHYRLLGIDPFEGEPNVIESAADRQMAHLRTFQTGKHSSESQQLLNEIAAAKVTLLSPQKKAAYDQSLRARLAGSKPAAPRNRPAGRDDSDIPDFGVRTLLDQKTALAAPGSCGVHRHGVDRPDRLDLSAGRFRHGAASRRSRQLAAEDRDG